MSWATIQQVGRWQKASEQMGLAFAGQPWFAFSGKVSDTPSPVSSDNATTPKRVQVAQGVSQGLLIHKVQPVYPAAARQDRVQGAVLLRAVIGKEDDEFEPLPSLVTKSEQTFSGEGHQAQFSFYMRL